MVRTMAVDSHDTFGNDQSVYENESVADMPTGLITILNGLGLADPVRVQDHGGER